MFVIAGLLMVIGSGAFSGIAAERGIELSVADDSTAYLRVQTENPVLRNNVTLTPNENIPLFTRGDIALLTLTNQLPSGVTLHSVEASIAGDTPAGPDAVGSPVEEAPLEFGTSGDVSVDVQCPGVREASETWHVTVTVKGTDTRITLTRGVTVSCDQTVTIVTPSPTLDSPVVFKGCGRVEVTQAVADPPFNATLLVYDQEKGSPQIVEQGVQFTIQGNGPLGATPRGGGQLVGIVFPDGTVYGNPNFDPDHPAHSCDRSTGVVEGEKGIDYRDDFEQKME